MIAKPRPLLGSLLGLLLGIVVVALLWQLGVVPPDRVVLFGVLAVTTLLVTVILTQRVALVRKRFVTVAVVCGLMGGFAIAGIPDAVAGGSISDGCSASGTSSIDSRTPDDTSIADPFDIARTDSVAWTGESTGVFTDWNSAIGIDVGGFPVKIWSGSSANEDRKQSNSGVEDVAGYLADIEDSTGAKLAGTYHVYGKLDAAEGGCTMSAYVRVEGEGAFAGTVNIGLWVALATLIIVILIMSVVVRRSISRSVVAAGPATIATSTSAPTPPQAPSPIPTQTQTPTPIPTQAQLQAPSPTEHMPTEGSNPVPNEGVDKPNADDTPAG